ncbi:unnamed protein product [Ceutorhynchus assimilis]|uniref:Uncharacterized protein n=1 Tax=Ceutorhynchus assimilis TaxID=467358 RepID=A0A9N9MHE3_9CUCU|nr:unnamed protein product [Ceutorhynchus assimilis]
MTFPMASRFSEYFSICTTGPSDLYTDPYQTPENGPNSITTRHYSLSAHKCDNNCLLQRHCKRSRYRHDACSEKPSYSKRQSLEPRQANLRGKNGTKSRQTDNKNQAQFLKRESLNFQSPENKENLPIPLKKKIISSIPRFRKNVTEGQSPSFMSRPRNIHDCLTNEDSDDPSFSTGNFNRNSLKRKSIKPKKTEEKNGPLLKRPFNVSYTVLPKLEEKSPKKLNRSANVGFTSTDKMLKNMSNIIKDMAGITWKGQILNDPISTNENFDNEKSPRVLTKNLILENELSVDECEPLNTLDKTIIDNSVNQIMEESGNKNVKEIENENKDITNNIPTNKNNTHFASEQNEDGLRSHDIFALQDCNLILLVNEEFIDDEYDSYIQDFNTSKGHLQVLQNNELYEMTRSLVRVYLQTNKIPENSQITQLGKRSPKKIQKVTGGKIGKYLNKRMKNKKTKKEDNWDEIEKIVKAAIKDLKGEFQREIFTKTNDKLDSLVSELKNVVFNANDDIESTCEKATANLISRLENIALKY